jgi:hypothetical protein
MDADLRRFEPAGEAMKKRRAPRVALVALAALAQVGVSRASDRVEARPGDTIRVTTSQTPAGGGIVGTLVELDPGTLTVVGRSESDRTRIRRDAITRLEVKRGGTRGKNVLIGAAIGLGVGLLLAAIETTSCDGEWLCGVEYAAFPILTAPAGALVGVAIPGNQRWVEVPPAGRAARPAAPGGDRPRAQRASQPEAGGRGGRDARRPGGGGVGVRFSVSF